MASWSGSIYASATLTGNGNSGWIDMEGVIGRHESYRTHPAFKQATLKLVPANLATDETLDLDLNVAWDGSGSGDTKLHDFTQVDSNNTEEFLVLPGGDSADVLVVATDLTAAVLPPWWKFTWVLGGSTKSMNFTVYGSLSW